MASIHTHKSQNNWQDVSHGHALHHTTPFIWMYTTRIRLHCDHIAFANSDVNRRYKFVRHGVRIGFCLISGIRRALNYAFATFCDWSRRSFLGRLASNATSQCGPIQSHRRYDWKTQLIRKWLAISSLGYILYRFGAAAANTKPANHPHQNDNNNCLNNVHYTIRMGSTVYGASSHNELCVCVCVKESKWSFVRRAMHV